MDSATISQGPRMSSTHLFGPALGAAVIADVPPVVFVVDDDVSVRESLQLLIRCEGWQRELSRPHKNCSRGRQLSSRIA